MLSQIGGVRISLCSLVTDLDLAERQQVEIAKALTRNPRLLVLDEATSALNAAVVQKAFELLRAESTRGVGVLFFSHRLHEIESLADRISVFHNGRRVETFDNGASGCPAIIDKMGGQKIDVLFPPKPPARDDAAEILRLETFGWEDAAQDVSISLRKGSGVGAARTLEMFGIPKTTFYRWYDRYPSLGEAGLEDRRPHPGRFWNRIPDDVRQDVVGLALEEPELSPRELAVRFTDTKKYFVSEASVYRILKAHDLIPSPAFIVVKAADEFRDKTSRPNQLCQTDFTYLKVVGWGWYYLSTILDDFSRYVIAWKLCTTMRAEEDETLFAIGSRTMVE
ncbi:helix-turn-helix domain-containing protein [Yangia mangrovi]|uniref:Helix-turn-helix domain-containing protein n=1 Tax=Alloyangia mangrovi TaxID=1779329 RepID=A0A2A3JW59_9RHOB|nr:helix-turn-helix domain-containing protein [Alloyangia mangrovi]